MRALAMTGRMALTVYVIHGIVLTAWFDAVCQRGRECDALDALLSALVLYGICVIAAYAWLSFFANGPLEAVMRFVAPTPGAVRRRRAARVAT